MPHAWIDIFHAHDGGKEILLKILDSYASAGRYYHNTQHLIEMTGVLEDHADKLQKFENTVFALLYHDVVYDTRAKDNEEKSAIQATSELTAMGLKTEEVEYIRDLILSTKKHQPLRDDFDTQLFLDADLAILGSDAVRYQEYMEAIRREYAWVEDAAYRAGRAQILEKFIGRDRIYFTDVIYATHEEKARQNIATEIDVLRNPP